jgi:hypothetical protein
MKTVVKAIALTILLLLAKQSNQLDDDGNANFTLKAKGSWTNANLVAICPVSEWDVVFASQVDSVITNPPVQSTPDQAFSVPS